MTTAAVVLLGALVLLAHVIAIALAHALRAYSRSRLEELCERRGRSARADEIARDDTATERAAESMAAITGVLLASLLAVYVAGRREWGTSLPLLIVLAVLAQLLAAVVGRAFAESIADSLWPVARVMKRAMTPVVFASRYLESAIERRATRGAALTPRPPSVEVEIHSRTADESTESEEELSDATRQMLERAVALRDRDVASLMTPRSSITVLHENTTLEDAARAFVASGLSRIPLYGEHRDDIVGILYVKDLIPFLLDAETHRAFQARKLARAPLFVPETKVASDLLDELRRQRVQLAIVLDEFGTVTGLITLEDLLEAIVGPIDDEHDTPTPDDPVVPIGERSFEVDAAIALEDLNERLVLDLPTDGDFQTLGGLAFDALGRVPEPGATFNAAGAEFTVLEVADHAIRRLRIDLKPATQPVGQPLGS